MRSKVEFRLAETDARTLLGPSVGRVLPSGLTRAVLVDEDDPAYQRIGAAHQQRRRRGDGGLFTSWIIRRTYNQTELKAAEIVKVEASAVFEPAGEECGTTYDESPSCVQCGAGRIQTSALALDMRRYQPERDIETQTLPRGVDVARTIADEVIISDRLAGLLRRVHALGVSVAPVVDCRTGSQTRGWSQLRVTSPPVTTVAPTRYGIDPFDDDPTGEYRCPFGHVAGLNLLSEVTVSRRSWNGDDIVMTAQLTGRRAGLLVPSPTLLASGRLYRLLAEAKVRGFRYEVAHLA